jgi:hypothetical protein
MHQDYWCPATGYVSELAVVVASSDDFAGLGIPPCYLLVRWGPRRSHLRGTHINTGQEGGCGENKHDQYRVILFIFISHCSFVLNTLAFIY